MCPPRRTCRTARACGPPQRQRSARRWAGHLPRRCRTPRALPPPGQPSQMKARAASAAVASLAVPESKPGQSEDLLHPEPAPRSSLEETGDAGLDPRDGEAEPRPLHPVGDRVHLAGLKVATALNGSSAVILTADRAKACYQVRLDDGSTQTVKAENVRPGPGSTLEPTNADPTPRRRTRASTPSAARPWTAPSESRGRISCSAMATGSTSSRWAARP